MRALLLMISLILSTTLMTLQAQSAGGNKNGGRRDQTPQQSFEQFKAEKTAFLTKEAQLTPEEAGKVFPIYDELQAKRFELNRKVRYTIREKMKSENNPTQQQYEWAAEELYTLPEKEAKIDRETYEKLKVILPAEKLFKLRVAEDRFMRHMMRKIESRQREEKQKK